MKRIDYDKSYWIQRAVLLAAINDKIATAKRKFFMNGDGSISEQTLRPTKGWKRSRVLSPTDSGKWLLS